MALAFILLSIIIAGGFFSLAIWIKDYAISMISGFFICCLGIYIAINGISNISAFLVDALSVVLICIGAYIFLNTGKEMVEDVM